MKLKIIFFIVIFSIFSFVLKSQDKLLYLKDAKITLKNNVTLFVNQPNPSGIVATSDGGIVSEGDSNRVVWKINNYTGTYTIPFWETGRIDFVYAIKTAGSSPGALIASTRGTGADNTPLPNVAPAVEDLNINGTDGSLLAADRFWILRKEGWTTEPSATLTFTYRDNAEIASPNTISEANLVAQFWGIGTNNGSTYSWIPDMFDLSHGYSYLGTVNTTANTVSGVSLGANNGGFYTWVLVDKNNPLPVTIIYFKVYCVGNMLLSNGKQLQKLIAIII